MSKVAMKMLNIKSWVINSRISLKCIVDILEQDV